jgi:exosortase
MGKRAKRRNDSNRSRLRDRASANDRRGGGPATVAVKKPEVELKRATQEELPSVSPAAVWRRALVGLIVLLPVLAWAYLPTWIWMESQWRNEPDYSHGYLVLPLAGFIAYSRRDTFPDISRSISWAGLSLILLAVVMRFVGRLAYMDFMDGWSLLPWVAGVVWMLFGWRACRWALPAIAFLILLVPLPYQAESLLSWRLQGIATGISTAMLRVLGQPAVAEGHTIWLGDTQLLVEEACSGLRIFVGIGALAFFWASVIQRSWLDRIVVLAAAFPLAIAVNSLRVTTVALFATRYQGTSLTTIHDWVGTAMIPVAALALWSVKIYWERLYRPMPMLTARHSLAVE